MKKILLSFFFLLSGLFTSQISLAAEDHTWSFTAQELSSMTIQKFKSLPESRKQELGVMSEVSKTDNDAAELYIELPSETMSYVDDYAQGIPPTTFEFIANTRTYRGKRARQFARGVAEGFVIGAATHLVTAGIGNLF